MKPIIVSNHDGQHANCPLCFKLKLRSLTFNDGTPKTHMHNGDHWDNNPVVERIKELQAIDKKETAAWEAKQAKDRGDQ